MSKPQIFHTAVEEGFNRIEGFRVYIDGVKGLDFYAYKQPKGTHKTAGWHICETTSGFSIAQPASSFEDAYDATCLVFETTPIATVRRRIARAVKKHGRAPEPEDIKS